MNHAPPRIGRALLAVAAALGASATGAEVPASRELKKLSLEELFELEVTSVSRRPEKLSRTSSAIQVITAEDMRRAGVSRLPEALRLASNLVVAQIDSRQWAISARGFNSNTANKLLVMIDGRTVYTPLYAGVFWDVQDTLLADIERIEVVSGPGATLWGANAVNGVINVSTKSAKDTLGLHVEGGVGAELRRAGGIRYGGTVAPGVHYRIYAKYFDRDSTVFSSGQDAGDDWHMGQAGFRVDWEAAAADRITFQGDYYHGSIAQPATGGVDVSGGNLLGRWTRTLAPESEIQVQVYYDQTYRRIPNTIVEDLDIFDIDFQHRFPVGDAHDLVWGLGYRMIDDSIVNAPVLAFLPPQVTREWFSGFVQDEISLVPDRVGLTLGTKVEHNEYTGFEVQPSVRLSWNPEDTQSVWAAISRAVRTPSRIDRELFAPRDPPFTILAGGPDFDSEELTAYELGYRVQLAPQLAAGIATFYHDYDQLRSLERVDAATPFPVVIGNGLRGESYGAELTADYHVSDTWRLHAGYTRLLIDLRARPGSTDTGGGSPESRDAEHQFFLRSSFDLPHGWEFDVAYRHVGAIANLDVPSYGELDAHLSWRASDQVEIALVGRNLLHDQHAEFGAAGSRREIERSIHGRITWRH